ncbi:MAG: helix-hairpin-helix domain-containing protein [Bacteroidota bacterium]
MKKWLPITLLITSLLSHAQNEEIDLEQFAERLFEIQDEDLSYEDVYESLLLYYTNKLNLNKVSVEELESLYILSPQQVSAFFDYRNQFGNLLSTHELQVIPGFNTQTVRTLLPFVTVQNSHVDNRPFLRRVIDEENNYFLLRYARRLERQIGFTSAQPFDTTFIENEEGAVIDAIATAPERYQGSPDKIYGRYKTSHRNDFSLGFTFEKDAGEAFSFDSNRKGFDYYSYHFFLENKLGFNKIVLGDFQIQAGQGIVFGAGFHAGKGAETVNTIKRNTLGLRPYTSVLESGFFRGIGLTRQFGNVELTGFYSNTKEDANIRLDSIEFSLIFESEQINGTILNSDPSQVFEEEFANSIITSGFHRTESELQRRNQIDEKSYGGTMTYSLSKWLMIGIAGLHTTYSVPLGKTPNNYNQFEFKGDNNNVFSFFSNYNWQNFTLFAETARSSSGGIGAVGGLIASLSKVVDFAIILRNYDRDFHSFYGNAFSENSRNINEKGTYWGISIKPNRKHYLNVYYDRFRFPWLKYRTEAPSVGQEWLVRYSHFPSRNVQMYTQVRQQTRQVTIPNDNLNILTNQTKHNYLFNINYKLTNGLQLKTRVQSSTQREGSEKTKGFAIIQDVNFNLWKLKFHTRTALFETDNFDNAQYIYENDVLYAFSIPAYHGTGIRNYIMLRYDPTRKISIWARYGRFTFKDRDEAGSGLNRSEGNTSSEIKMMLRIKF